MTDSSLGSDSQVMVSDSFPRAAAKLGGSQDCASLGAPEVRPSDSTIVKKEISALTIDSVYCENFAFVWRCLRHLGVPEAALDDGAQEVFLVVDRKLSEFSGDVRPWLYAIVRRIALRHRARARTEAARFVPEETTSAAETLSRDLRLEMEQRERLAIAFRALERLDDTKREVFVFCLIEGLSAPEVASIVGAPLNTVYSRLRAARQEFAAAVRADQSAPGASFPRKSQPGLHAPETSSRRRNS